MKKIELREEIRRALGAMTQEAREAESARICHAIRALPVWPSARTVAAFLPLRSEPQIQRLWEENLEIEFCFPRISGPSLELIRVVDRAALRDATWTFDGAAFSACPVVDPYELDVILVPGVAFTRQGHRLGRGRGYYDRLLAGCPPKVTRIGVCYDLQMRDALPQEIHDLPVDLVVTGADPA